MWLVYPCLFPGLLILLLPLVVLATEPLTPGIAPEELNSKLKAGEELLIIDVREPHEFNYVRLPGAVNIRHTDLEFHLDEIRQAPATLLYCMDGRRTREAEKTLSEQGITNLYHLRGSLPAWVQGGFQIEKGPPKRRVSQ
jgi:rhodanese-related sulfurtransferase